MSDMAVATLLHHTPLGIMGDGELSARTMLRCACDKQWRRADAHAQHISENLS